MCRIIIFEVNASDCILLMTIELICLCCFCRCGISGGCYLSRLKLTCRVNWSLWSVWQLEIPKIIRCGETLCSALLFVRYFAATSLLRLAILFACSTTIVRLENNVESKFSRKLKSTCNYCFRKIGCLTSPKPYKDFIIS